MELRQHGRLDALAPLAPRGRGVGGEGEHRASAAPEVNAAAPSPQPSPARGEGAMQHGLRLARSAMEH